MPVLVGENCAVTGIRFEVLDMGGGLGIGLQPRSGPSVARRFNADGRDGLLL